MKRTTKAEKCKKWREENPDHKERKNAVRNRRYAEDPDYRKRTNRENVLKMYKWTPDIYDRKLEEQGGHCALCEAVNGDQKKRLHVDHDHECCTGKRATCGKCNRGIICQVCNTRLGYLEQLMKDFPKERGDQAEIYLRNSVTPDSWTYRALKYLKAYEPKLLLRA